MKQKIVDALKTKYSNLGLGNDVFEGVAASIETFITDEAKIPDFVAKAESMLKKYQSMGDKDRTAAAEANKKVADLQAQLDEAKKKLNPNGGGDDKDKDKDKDKDDDKDLTTTIASAVAAAIKPLSEKLTTLESASASKAATASAKEKFFANDYAKKYKDEADDAWERTMEVYEATGSKLTAEELTAKAQGYFNKSVSRKGVDTSKPFESDTQHEAEGTMDWAEERKRKQSQGKIAADTK